MDGWELGQPSFTETCSEVIDVGVGLGVLSRSLSRAEADYNSRAVYCVYYGYIWGRYTLRTISTNVLISLLLDAI